MTDHDTLNLALEGLLTALGGSVEPLFDNATEITFGEDQFALLRIDSGVLAGAWQWSTYRTNVVLARGVADTEADVVNTIAKWVSQVI